MSFILNSGLKIFDVIDILNKKPFSRAEILKKLDFLDVKSERTAAKYLATLKKAGFLIKFKNKKFNLVKTPIEINLNEDETKGYLIFLSFLKNIFSLDNSGENLVQILELNIKQKEGISVIPPAFYDVIGEKEFNHINKVKKYLYDGYLRAAHINYNNSRIIAVIKEIKYTENGIYFVCFDLNKGLTEYLDVKLVDLIEFTTRPVNEFIKKFYKTSFKIFDILKKNYVLKDGEEIHYTKNDMIISNDVEDKEELLSRLVRYGVMAEVLYPEADKRRFIQKLDELEEHFKSI